MKKIVLVPLKRSPTPCASRPSSLANDSIQMFRWSSRLTRSRYWRILPVCSSMTWLATIGWTARLAGSHSLWRRAVNAPSVQDLVRSLSNGVGCVSNVGNVWICWIRCGRLRVLYGWVGWVVCVLGACVRGGVTVGSGLRRRRGGVCGVVMVGTTTLGSAAGAGVGRSDGATLGGVRGVGATLGGVAGVAVVRIGGMVVV